MLALREPRSRSTLALSVYANSLRSLFLVKVHESLEAKWKTLKRHFRVGVERPQSTQNKKKAASPTFNIHFWLYSYLAMNTQMQLDLVFAALADSTRRAMLVRLSQGEATVNELAAPFGLRQPTISKHLRVLEDAGLIQQVRDAQRRPRRLVIGGPLKDLDVWLRPFREQWEQRFENLDLYLQKLNQTSHKEIDK
jgi:DNA-binding transcriptional ArsR family regulator